MMTLKYTVKLINKTTGEVVRSAPASRMENAKNWGTVAKREAGKGHAIKIEKN